MTYYSVTEKDLQHMALYAFGQIDRFYLHWTAGTYTAVYPDYHLSILGNGEILAPALDLTTRLAHTWQRNSRAVGIALCCAQDATPHHLGDFPPSLVQVEALCRSTAILLDTLKLPVSFDTVRTHAEQADLDGYGPDTTCERWDLWMLSDGGLPGSGGPLLRGKIRYYMQVLKQERHDHYLVNGIDSVNVL